MKRKKHNIKPINGLVKASGAVAVAAALTVTAFALSCCSKAEAVTNPDDEIHLEVKCYYDCPLDFDTQDRILEMCNRYDISPALIVGQVETESGFDAHAIGDGGYSKGLMQIQERWHGSRMDELGVTDLFDPVENVTVGIDYLAELIEDYNGSTEKALTAYCNGKTGAQRHFFSRGITSSPYSRKVLTAAEKYEKEGMTTMLFTDNPEADFERYDAEQQAELSKLPVCDNCGEHVQDDHYYLINDEVICPDCLEIDYRKSVEDYVY